MDLDADFIVNPVSSILGVLSFVGFFILARKELGLFLRKWLRIGYSTRAEDDARRGFSEVPRATFVPGLVLMGLAFSAAVMLVYNRLVSEMDSDLVYFLLVMLPGGLVGFAAGLWIHLRENNRPGAPLTGLLIGITVYLALFTIAEFSQFDIVLLLFGPLTTLLVYRLSPTET